MDGRDLWKPHGRSLVGERLEKERGGLSDEREAFGEDGGGAIPELDVIAARGARFETNGACDHKGRGFRFGFANALRGSAAAFSAMQEFVRQFVSQSGKLFGERLAREKYDFPATGDAPGGSDLVRIFERNSLRLGECLEPNGAVPGIALNGSHRRQFL